MHDPALTPDDLLFDFGITALGASFHGDWLLDADSEQEHIASVTASTEHGILGQSLLVEDVLRLRDSALTGPEIAALWALTNRDAFDGSPSIEGRERPWLDEVLAVVTPVIRAYGAPSAQWTTVPPCPPGHAHRHLAGEVTALLNELTPRQDAGVTSATATAALTRCAELVCSELAFRDRKSVV